MTLASNLEKLAKLNSYDEREQFFRSVKEKAVKFLQEHMPALRNEISIDKFDIFLYQRSLPKEIMESVLQCDVQEGQDASEFIILLKDSRATLAFISLFSRFLTRVDIETCFKFSEENIYWVNNFIRDIICDGVVRRDRSWLEDYLLLGHGNSDESKAAFCRLFENSVESYSYEKSVFNEIKSRVVGTFSASNALTLFDEQAIAQLSNESQKKYLQELATAGRRESHEWIALDKKLKPYGVRMINLKGFGSEEAAQYLAAELEQHDDPNWVVQLVQYADRYAGIPDRIKATVQQYLLKWEPKIDFSQFSQDACRHILDPKLIELVYDKCCRAGQVKLADNYGAYFEQYGELEKINWDFVLAHVDDMAERWMSYGSTFLPLARMHWFWEHASKEKAKCRLLLSIYMRIAEHLDIGKDPSNLVDLYVKWFGENPAVYDCTAAASTYIGEDAFAECAVLMWPHLGSKVRTQFAENVNRYHEDHFVYKQNKITLFSRVCVHDLKTTLFVPENNWSLLQFLTDNAFEQVMENLETIEKSTAAIKHFARGLANIRCETLEEAGLYVHPKKNIREAAQWSLIQTQDMGKLKVIKELITNKKAKLNEAQLSHLLDVLDENDLDKEGKLSEELDPVVNEDLKQYCEKKLNATLKKKLVRIWNSELETFWGGDSVILEYALCVLAQNTWGGVPRFTRQCFELRSAPQRKQLTIQLIEAWAEGKADKADFWVLDLLKVYADENTIPLLQKLVTQWHKKYRLRAATVVTALGEMDTVFALSTCEEFRKKAKFSDDVRYAAAKALSAAAERRGITLVDLYDELVPSFGLESDGLRLDAGPRTYLVKLKSTLDLDVVDESSGRAYKNLPKAKKDEDSDKRVEIESQFKLLKKNIKPLVKTLQDRFTESFECGQLWNTERWQRLFQSHPILSLIGQGFVWQCDSGNNRLCFRLSEDLSLIDVDDNPVELDNGEIRIMHPADVDVDLCAAWQEHFSDYEITSFVDQFGAHNLAGITWDSEANSLTEFHKKPSPYGKFKRILEKNNYQSSGGDGSWIDSYQRSYINAKWRVELNLLECRVYMGFEEDVILGDINFYYDGKISVLNKVPRRLLATVVKLMGEIQ